MWKPSSLSKSRPRSIATSNSSGRRRSEPLTSIGAHRNTRFILGKSKENPISESATILYAGDTFTVRETLFVPVDAQGAIIVLNVETEQPLEIEAAFHRDFQLEWPAALGAAYIDWSAPQHAFYFGEEQRKF